VSSLSSLSWPCSVGRFAPLIWVYQTWDPIALEHRQMPIVPNASPLAASLHLVAPCFTIVRMFSRNIGIANSLNAAMMARGSLRRVNTAWPILGAIFYMVPYSGA